MDDRPENFQITFGANDAQVDRYFEFKEGTISMSVRVPFKNEMTVMDLHRKSMQTAIDQLQKILDLSNPKP